MEKPKDEEFVPACMEEYEAAGQRNKARLAKQVIVIRKDLKMRRGKEIAQGAHAAMAWLTRLIVQQMPPRLTSAETVWLTGKFTKIVCTVDSEVELLQLYVKAQEAHLRVCLIEDSGATEFNGVPTNTCLAIGPDWSELIDPITSHLKLY
jgi:PTH2 family peptidyl-tRNA hydrolase